MAGSWPIENVRASIKEKLEEEFENLSLLNKELVQSHLID